MVQTLSPLSGCARIQVVSIHPGEGTTTVTLSLAETLTTHAGARVVVVDANLQSPRLHREFGLNESPGLVDFLDDTKLELPEIVQKSGQGFDVIVSGLTGTDGSGNLQPLASKSCGELTELLEHKYDYVLFDTPPITRFPGIYKMVSHFQGLILVVECNKTRWEVARNAKEKLEMANAHLCGVVMNKRRFQIPSWLYRYV